MTLGPTQQAIISHIKSSPHGLSYANEISKALGRSLTQINAAIRSMVLSGILEYADEGPPGENADGSAARFGKATGPVPRWVRVSEEWEGNLMEEVKPQE